MAKRCSFWRGGHDWSQWEDTGGGYVEIDRQTGTEGIRSYEQTRRCRRCNKLDLRIVTPRKERY